MPKHKVYRDGKLFDEMDTESHAVVQIVRSIAQSDPGKRYSIRDENDESYYEVVVNPPKQWKVSNGPFATGGEIEETGGQA